MRCNKGKILNKIINQENNCDECKILQKVTDIILEDVYLFYTSNLLDIFKSLVPIEIDGQLIIVNPTYINDLSADEILREKTNYIGINGEVYHDKKEIANKCNLIMGLILDDVKNLIEDNPKQYIIALLSMLEYCNHLVSSLVIWLNSNMDEIENPNDDVAFMIKQLNNIKKYSKEQFPYIYKTWEGELSSEKYGIQNMIEILNYFSSDKELIIEKINSLKLQKLLQYTRALQQLLYIKDEAINGGELEINGLGDLLASNKYDYDEFTKYYVDSMAKQNRDNLNDEAKKRFNKICKRYIGLQLEEIFCILKKFSEYYYNNDEFIICDVQNFSRIIEDILPEVPKENITKFINYLVYDVNTFKFPQDANLNDNRVLRKCLMPILNNVFASPAGIIKHSLLGLYMDIINANIPKGDFQKELFKVKSDYIDKKFEVQVGQFLKENLNGVYVKWGIEKDEVPDINNKGKFIDLYGEIDVILIIKGKMIVIECKNPILKLTPKEINNETNRFEKESPKFFQTKLQKKINKIYLNWDSVIEYLNVPNTIKIEKDLPMGVIVTSTFNLSLMNENLKFPVLLLNDLIEWLDKNII